MSNIDVELDEKTKKRTLGFIVAVSWFSSDLIRCVKKLSTDLLESIDNKTVSVDYFNNKRFQTILERDKNGRILMRPLPAPDMLRSELKNAITKHPDFNAVNKKSGLWTSNDLWQLFRGSDGDKIPVMLKFFASHLGANEKEDKIQISDTWWLFLHKVLYDRRFILYAQRNFIRDNYKWFDPTLPDQIRDHNRPWDYDHILPYSWSHHISTSTRKIKSDISYLVRLWVNVNGNIRAWPLELNRSKGNHEVLEEKVEEYNYSNLKAVCDASFIEGNGEIWREIEDKVREGKATDNEESKHFRQPGDHWTLFIEASIDRTADIYEEWYDSLAIKELME